MSCVKYFSVFVLLNFTTLQIATASIIDKKCGIYTYRVKITKGLNAYDTQFSLYYKLKNQKSILFYKAESIFNLLASCIQNDKGAFQFLFQETNGGNVGPEDIYGLFDPDLKKMLLKPADWPNGNDLEVKKYTGYLLPPMVFDSRTFCCTGDQIDGENS